MLACWRCSPASGAPTVPRGTSHAHRCTTALSKWRCLHQETKSGFRIWRNKSKGTDWEMHTPRKKARQQRGSPIPWHTHTCMIVHANLENTPLDYVYHGSGVHDLCISRQRTPLDGGILWPCKCSDSRLRNHRHSSKETRAEKPAHNSWSLFNKKLGNFKQREGIR